MYTEKQIQLVMWMPKPTDSDEYCHLVLDTLRNLMDVCKENVVVEQETWSIAPLMNPTGMTRAYMYDATNLDRWQQDKKLMCNDCTNIDVKADYVTEKKAKRAIRAYARIHDLRPKEFQDQNLEIVVEIPRSCWQKISVDDFKAGTSTTAFLQFAGRSFCRFRALRTAKQCCLRRFPIGNGRRFRGTTSSMCGFSAAKIFGSRK